LSISQDVDNTDDIRSQFVALLPALRSFARGFYPNPDEADDLVQETLGRALGGLHTFTPGTSLKSWMFTIMRNTFYTAIKRRRREPAGMKADVAESEIPREPSQEWVLRAKELEAALHQLEPENREAIMLVCVSGVSYAEASEICGCAVGTIKSRISRGKAQLLLTLGNETRSSIVEKI
jgi:RNA polymerase sigma-70 factor, ECF subfamily